MKRIQARELRYEIERSPLYGLSNKKKLSELLRIDHKLILHPDKSGLTSQYRIFKDRKTRRFITEPVDQLADIHRRLLKLLTRIAPPAYIHSAIKKRSYKTNAEQHKNSSNVLKIDLKKFFPSVKFGYIYDFFLNTLRCAKDIATILAKLCTVQTEKYGVHLPTGSCISPILSFLANRKMFDAIKAICEERGCAFTVYVDDVTVSGANASRELLSEIAKVIHKHGYLYHKIKIYSDLPATVTGLVIDNGRLCLPHKRAKKIRELEKALSVAKNNSLRNKLLASLVGHLSEAEHINTAYKPLRLRILSRYATEWSDVVAYRLRKARLKAALTTG